MPAPDSSAATDFTERADAAGASFITDGDPPAFEVHLGHASGSALITCDHASCAIPMVLGDLGLSPAARRRHIAWDIGAADLALALGDRLAATVVLAGYSRLVIDCNRRLDDPSCFVALADGDPVPGNARLTPAAIGSRVASCYEPYHQAITAELLRFHDRGGLVLGICNGFQVLVRAGLLPGGPTPGAATLTFNDSGHYESRWVRLKPPTRLCLLKWTCDARRAYFA